MRGGGRGAVYIDVLKPPRRALGATKAVLRGGSMVERWPLKRT